MVRPAIRLSNAGSQEDLGGQNTLGDQAAGAMAPATAGVEALRTGRVRALRSCALRLERVGLLLLWFLLLAAGVSGLLLQGSWAWMGSPGTGVAVALAWGGSDTLRVLPSMTGRRACAGRKRLVSWSQCSRAEGTLHGEPKGTGQDRIQWREPGTRRRISTSDGRRCFGCAAVAMPPPPPPFPPTNRKQSN